MYGNKTIKRSLYGKVCNILIAIVVGVKLVFDFLTFK